jgi:dihydropteroate synthase
MQNVDAAGLGIGDDYPPRIMGVLNVSDESPYEPSVFDDAGDAAAYVDRELIDEGADIVDVGLESANKRFDVLPAEAELDRLDTAVEAMESTGGDAVWSIETRYAEVAAEALDAGFDMVNDVCGFADPEMPRVCAERDAAVVKMASPPDLGRPGAVEEVDDIYEALKRGGLTEKTIVDPAFGGWSEAKTLEHDRETFRRLREFRALGRPMLVSINRKNFLKDVAGRDTEGALPVSLAATSMAVERGAHVIRTHDVAETRDAALVGETFARGRYRRGGKGDGSPNGGAAGSGGSAETGGAGETGTVRPAETDGVAVEELDVTTVREAERHLEAVGSDDAVEAAPDCVARVVELSRLDAAERRSLADACEGTGAVLAGGDGGRVVLAGSLRSIAATAEAVDENGALARALDGVLGSQL